MATYRVVVFLLCVFGGLAMPGGWETVNPKSNDARKVAEMAVTEVDAQSNSPFRSRLMVVTHVKRQVVAGYLYKIAFELGQTDCQKGGQDDLESCQVHSTQDCTAKVWVKEWENFKQVSKLTCGQMAYVKKPATNKKPQFIPGAPIHGDSKDEDIKAAALFALNTINAKSNSLYKLGLGKVKEVTKQLVAGVKYTMTVDMGHSQCRNDGEELDTLMSCVPDESQVRECKLVVLDQVWMKPRYSLLDFTCQEDKPEAPNNSDATMEQDHKHLLGADSHDYGTYTQFQAFKTKYSKVYDNHKEEMKRFMIFRSNMEKARDLQKNEMGTAKYGATKFADLTQDEFKKYLGFRPDLSHQGSLKLGQAEIPAGEAPTSFDWRDHDAVTPVKNQGSCGSCWAFSTTGNVEGQWAIKKGMLVSLSEQELVDCDKLDSGCEGGLPTLAYESIMKLGGLETEKDYPYEGSDDKCVFKKSMAKVDINGAVNISKSEADMAAWLAKNGPISIGINAFAMQFYFGGISHPWKIFCNPTSLDHGVLIVGYGVQGSEPYWIIKNSWGPDWGEKGYYLLYRGGGVCGVNQMPTSAVVN